MPSPPNKSRYMGQLWWRQGWQKLFRSNSITQHNKNIIGNYRRFQTFMFKIIFYKIQTENWIMKFWIKFRINVRLKRFEMIWATYVMTNSKKNIHDDSVMVYLTILSFFQSKHYLIIKEKNDNIHTWNHSHYKSYFNNIFKMINSDDNHEYRDFDMHSTTQ